MSNVSIVAYQDADYEDLLSLLLDSFEDKFLYKEKMSKEQIKDFLRLIWHISESDDSYEHYVAKVDGRLVGDILIQTKPKKERGVIPFFKLVSTFGFFVTLFFLLKMAVLATLTVDDYYIEHILVDASCRGQGIGNQLLSKADEIASRDQQSISLMVASDNPAKHLYDRKGYQDESVLHSKLLQFFVGMKDWVHMKKESV